MLDTLVATLIQGFAYALLSYGVYITYSILDFPDLTVDGSFPLGAAVTAVLLMQGVNSWLTLPAAMAAGALAGLCTGLIHVKCHVRNLLASIITMTALSSVNLLIAGSNITIARGTDTIFSAAPVSALFGSLSLSMRKFIVLALIALLAKVILDLYFRTKSGLLLRATGDNGTLVTSLAKNRGNMKILGLVIANALVALSGAVVCQESRSYSAVMGIGQVVFGLAAVIIGVALFRKLSFVRGTTAVLFGSIIYKLCIQVALSAGLPPVMLKLITAALFLVVLVITGRRGEEIIRA